MKSIPLFLLLAPGLAAQQPPPPHWAFSQDQVHEIKLTFSQPDWWEQLTRNFEDNDDDVPYIQADIEWGPYKMANVGARFKGNSSYNGATTKKKPFRIKLNEFVKGQKIGGMASFNLSNGWNDPSLIRETVYYNIAGWAGFTGPRSNFAALTINGQYWGLYVLGEIVNGDFLTHHFGSGNDKGNLYKADIGANLTDLGDDPAPYKRVFEKQSNEDADDWSDLINLVAVLNRTPIEQLPEKIEPILDIDSILSGIALDNLTVNLDSYIGQLAQNYHLYRRPSDNRFVWILWDPSLAFGAFGGGGGQSAAGSPASLSVLYSAAQQPGQGGQLPPGGQPPTPPGGGQPPTPPGGGQPPTNPGGQPGGFGGGGGRPLFTRLMEIPKYKERYGQIYRWLATEFLTTGEVTTRMKVLHDMIRPWVARDTQKLSTMEQFEKALSEDQTLNARPGGTPGAPGGGGLGAVSPGLQPFFRDRLESVRQQLAIQPDGTWGSTSAAPPVP